jgi:hypothetical protein
MTDIINTAHIKPLAADNFVDWQPSMIGLLMEKGWTDHISADANMKPGDKTDQKLVGLIYSRMETSQRNLLGLDSITKLQSITAKQLWDRICRHHTTVSLQKMATYFQQLDKPYDEGQKMDAFLAEKQDIIRKLAAASFEMPEALTCLRVLYCLLESWSTLRSILINTAVVTLPTAAGGRATSSLTFDTLSASLLGEEAQRATMALAGHIPAELSALYTRNPSRPPPRGGRPTCTWCGVQGHTEVKCFSKERGEDRVKQSALTAWCF